MGLDMGTMKGMPAGADSSARKVANNNEWNRRLKAEGLGVIRPSRVGPKKPWQRKRPKKARPSR